MENKRVNVDYLVKKFLLNDTSATKRVTLTDLIDIFEEMVGEYISPISISVALRKEGIIIEGFEENYPPHLCIAYIPEKSYRKILEEIR